MSCRRSRPWATWRAPAQVAERAVVPAALRHHAETRTQYAAEAEAARNDFSKSWSDYNKMVVGDQEARLAGNLRKAWQHSWLFRRRSAISTAPD
ncbi:MAG: hypothetical protein WDN06_04730 [Asticcacaulis sp.]